VYGTASALPLVAWLVVVVLVVVVMMVGGDV